MIGQTVSHYQVLEKLGDGGMGVVYKALDTKLGRPVALKFLPEELSQDPVARERFLREARAAAALSHPHICTIHEIDEHDGVTFIAMEYLEGRTLKQAIDGRPMAADTVVELALQITEAVAAAHTKGILHRDLKPSNVFVSTQGQIKVLDFGLAKAAPGRTSPEDDETIAADDPTLSRELTTAGTAPGTVAYMSPEQALGQDLDARSDLFSLGTVLYEMVTGHQAFAGSTQAATFDKILNRPPVAPARLGLEPPLELEQILAKSLEKDRRFRYQSAVELHTDLKRLQRSLQSGSSSSTHTIAGGVPEGSGTSWEAAPPSSGSHPAAPVAAGGRRRSWWIAATVVVALAAGYFAATRFTPQAEPPPTLTESDVILLTDFANTTGDPVFDGTLEQALAVKLEESPFLNVFPERQVHEALGYMSLPEDTPLTPEVGQELCERQGLKAMLTGEVAALGSHYVVTLAAVECHSGQSLAREQLEAESKEAVLGAVGEAATSLRQKLGESLASIERYDAPVDQATTPSLEALKAFSLGEEQRARGAEESAIPFYQRALELDPDFALAHGRLGTVFINLGEFESGAEQKRRAFELRDRVSERERLYITAHYYSTVTGEVDKEIQAYQLFKRTYPREWTPPNNLAVLYNDRLGRYEQALEEARTAHRLAPDQVFPYTNLGAAYKALGRLDEAEDVLDEAIRRDFVFYSIFTDRYQIAFLEGDWATMKRLSEEAAGTPAEPRMLEQQAQAAASRGRLEESRELFQKAVETAQSQGLSQLSSLLTARGALAEAWVGDPERARAWAQEAVTTGQGRDTLRTAALALALTGADEEALALAEDLRQSFPDGTIVNTVHLPVVRAALASREGKPQQVVEELRSASPYERAHMETIYLRGKALLAAGDAAASAEELQKIVGLAGVDATSPLHLLARLELARAQAANGDLAGALESYGGVIDQVEGGDPDLAVRRAAESELSDLPLPGPVSSSG